MGVYLTLQDSKKDVIKKKFQLKLIVPKITTILINLVQLGPRVILRSSMQLLRANIWIRIVSTIMMLIVDVVRHARGHTSGKQFIIDISLSLSLLVGGTFGWYAGTGVVIAENTALWVLAGVIGSGSFGALAEIMTRTFLVRYITTDIEIIMKIFNREFDQLTEEFQLTEEQRKEMAQTIRINTQTCMLCFKSQDREKYARKFLEPYFDQI